MLKAWFIVIRRFLKVSCVNCSFCSITWCVCWGSHVWWNLGTFNVLNNRQLAIQTFYKMRLLWRIIKKNKFPQKSHYWKLYECPSHVKKSFQIPFFSKENQQKDILFHWRIVIEKTAKHWLFVFFSRIKWEIFMKTLSFVYCHYYLNWQNILFVTKYPNFFLPTFFGVENISLFPITLLYSLQNIAKIFKIFNFKRRQICMPWPHLVKTR